MATVSEPNLTIELATNGACDSLFLADITGTYSAVNPGGYGLSGGPAVNDITTVTVVLTYNTLGSYITYVFTVLNGAITDATLAVQTATPTNIFAMLTSTVWPFATTLPFNLTADYGVSIPTFADDVFSVSYTIEGTVDITPFTFNTVDDEAVVCQTQCCINKKFAEVDWSCGCSSDKLKQSMMGQALINQVSYATSIGDLTAAVDSLNQAKLICDTSKGGCGCS